MHGGTVAMVVAASGAMVGATVEELLTCQQQVEAMKPPARSLASTKLLANRARERIALVRARGGWLVDCPCGRNGSAGRHQIDLGRIQR